jgi:hypothetical protein
MDDLSIQNTEFSDLKSIYGMFEQAIAYQQKKNYPVWRGYDKQVLATDMQNRVQFKIMRGKDIGCVFSICYADKIIWRERDRGDSVFLHRIVTHPDFKGQRLFGEILHWTEKLGRENGLLFIRMDTWADNPPLVDYYLNFGFTIAGYFTTPDSEALPVQQRNNEVVLLEYKIFR